MGRGSHLPRLRETRPNVSRSIYRDETTWRAAGSSVFVSVCTCLCLYMCAGVVTSFSFISHGEILGRRGFWVRADPSSMLAKRVKCHHKDEKRSQGGRKEDR